MTEGSLISGNCTIRVMGSDIDRQGAELLLLVVSAKALKKGRANNMTLKEKIRIHHQIEQENKRKLKEWKEARKNEHQTEKVS